MKWTIVVIGRSHQRTPRISGPSGARKPCPISVAHRDRFPSLDLQTNRMRALMSGGVNEAPESLLVLFLFLLSSLKSSAPVSNIDSSLSRSE